MKDIMQIGIIKDAMEKVITNSDASNGTDGLEFECVLYRTQLGYDKERKALEAELNEAMLKRDTKKYTELEEKLNTMPDVTKFFIFKLLKPMVGVNSTLKRKFGNKMGTLSMDVNEIWMTDFFMQVKAAKADEVKDGNKPKKWLDPATNKEYPVLKIKLEKGMVDIFPPRLTTWNGKQEEVLPKRAMCTLISLHSMQVLGRISARERVDAARMYGFDLKDIA
jgi:hypothetical protein